MRNAGVLAALILLVTEAQAMASVDLQQGVHASRSIHSSMLVTALLAVSKLCANEPPSQALVWNSRIPHMLGTLLSAGAKPSFHVSPLNKRRLAIGCCVHTFCMCFDGARATDIQRMH
eukprot:353426-Chlamydomonas_euryale.AAC.4